MRVNGLGMIILKEKSLVDFSSLTPLFTLHTITAFYGKEKNYVNQADGQNKRRGQKDLGRDSA